MWTHMYMHILCIFFQLSISFLVCLCFLQYWYKEEHGLNDDGTQSIETPIAETEFQFSKETLETDVPSKSIKIARDEAIFGHRDNFLPKITTGCPTRARLTSSQPSRSGSMFYELGLPVYDGFECAFTYQVSIYIFIIKTRSNY